MSVVAKAAREAVARYPDSQIEVALDFCQAQLPEFLSASNDRLLKVGRSIVSLVDLAGENDAHLEACLENVIQECRLLVSGTIKVPKVKFGKTDLEMPIVTLGCMRFQQEWGDRIQNMNMIGSDCQDNLVAILKQAIDYGINHIETARGYGCSEIQLGVALKQLFLTNYVKREDLIIQSKIPAMKDAGIFRQALETIFKNLQVDYLDLFSLHGLNLDVHLEYAFGSKEGDDCCYKVLQEYVDAGKIRHIGFSTHGSTNLIIKAIETDKFDYVNLHHHYFGSYTASNLGHDGNGNLDAVKILHSKGMGIFIISPFDKGGRLYAPSRQLRTLTLPELEPMNFGCNWIFMHHKLEGQLPPLHTFTVGAGRPSDLDQPAVAAYLQATQPDEILSKLLTVTKRLDSQKESVLGKEWVESCYKGLPKNDQCKSFIDHNQIIWIYNNIRAFGMFDFGKARFASFEGNGKKWDDSLSPQENIDKMGFAWGFVPGLPLKPDTNYDDDLVNVPEENKERVKEAEAFVYKWCHTEEKEKGDGDKEPDSVVIPKEWETAYDMRPWPDYPDQPSRK
jgi:predicted aldo/keto reductase-like oxidoreductase